MPRGTSRRAPEGYLCGWLVVCCLLLTTGCGAFGGGKQLKTVQMENDRLLAEYRAQRDRLAALQETNAALEARLGESEKLLARLGQTTPANRISRAEPPARTIGPNGGLPADTSSRSSAASNNSTYRNGTGSPYSPGASIPSLGPGAGAGNDEGLQWRPLRRP